MTERKSLESERAELIKFIAGCRQLQIDPDLRDDLIARVQSVLRLAAQDQKPVAYQCAGCGRLCGDPKADFDDLKSRGFLSCCPERKMEPVSAPPAAGWDIPDQITPELACIMENCGGPEMQTPEAVAALIRDYQPIWAGIVKALRRNAPPDSGAGKSAEAPPVDRTMLRHIVDAAYCHAMTVPCFPDFKTADKIIDHALTGHPAQGILAVLPDHGGADAGVRAKPLEWLSGMAPFFAVTPVCTYRISKIGDDMWETSVSYRGPLCWRHKTTEDDAKAISQTHYEKTILSALSHQPAPVAANASAVATYRLGRWLAAALEDPNVCAEMKADIDAWIDAGRPNVQPSANASTEQWATELPDGSVSFDAYAGWSRDQLKDRCLDLIGRIEQLEEAANASAEASDRLGSWMAAALEDPNVCPEMKADIEAWFDTGKANASAEARLRLPVSELIEEMAKDWVAKKWQKTFREDCERLVQVAISAHPHASDCDKQPSSLVKSAKAAAERVSKWSDAKQDYARRVSDCDKQGER